MPGKKGFSSKAQMQKFYADPQLREHADKMLAETPGRLSDLPDRVKRPPPKGGKRRG
jgi:hypothetical protein